MTKYDFSCQTIMQILARHKPAGMNKHFSMAVVVESLANTLDEDKQVEQTSCQFSRTVLKSDIIKSNRRLIADPKVPAKARILRQKCHLRQNSVNCDKCDNLHQNSTICIKTSQFA